MKTRSRTVSQSVDTPTKSVATEKKGQKTKTPKKQSHDEVLAGIISSIKEENSSEKSKEAKTTEIKQEKEVKNVSAPPKKGQPKAVRGLPKSGRPWKDAKKKFSSIKKSTHRPSFQKKEKLREEIKHIKELSKSIKEDKRLENVAKKERREENAKRRLENERKNEIVQIIKNPAKLKRMKKKALRKIEKRDLTVGNGPKVV